jgi:hypothetical protein
MSRTNPVVVNEGVIKKGGLNPPPTTYRPPAPSPLKPPAPREQPASNQGTQRQSPGR